MNGTLFVDKCFLCSLISHFWLMVSAGTRCGGRGGDNFSTLESATLGLLVLIIGFTFAMALSRFEARRDAIVNEANAIGTTALRARLLPQPHRTETLNFA